MSSIKKKKWRNILVAPSAGQETKFSYIKLQEWVGAGYRPKNGNPSLWASSSYSMLEQCNAERIQSSILREEGQDQDHAHQKQRAAIFSFLSFKKKTLRDNSNVSVPARTLGRRIQFRSWCCFWSEGYHHALEFSLLCSHINTSAQRPNAVVSSASQHCQLANPSQEVVNSNCV